MKRALVTKPEEKTKHISLTESQAVERSKESDVFYKQSLNDFVKNYRKEVGNGYLQYNDDLRVKGDSDTRAAISETIQFWKELPDTQKPASIDWEYESGKFYMITLAELIDLGLQLGLRRQKTFSVKKAVIAQIDAGNITSESEAKSAFDQGMAS